jgi:uncharacterized protein YecT (DUF1311 family)
MKILLLILAVFCSCSLFAQYDADAKRLKAMVYMKYADKRNCNNPDASSLDHRVCLNLEFQKVDAILNKKFKQFIGQMEADSTRTKLIDFHKSWIEHRRFQSKRVATGYRGHHLGIVYLGCMVNMTKRRIEELEYFTDRE